MAETPAALTVRVFTHPACASCPAAVREAWATVGKHPGVALRTVSLEDGAGLVEAQSEAVRTIPTVILESPEGELRRWIGSPEPGALERALTELRATA